MRVTSLILANCLFDPFVSATVEELELVDCAPFDITGFNLNKLHICNTVVTGQIQTKLIKLSYCTADYINEILRLPTIERFIISNSDNVTIETVGLHNKLLFIVECQNVILRSNGLYQLTIEKSTVDLSGVTGNLVFLVLDRCPIEALVHTFDISKLDLRHCSALKSISGIIEPLCVSVHGCRLLTEVNYQHGNQRYILTPWFRPDEERLNKLKLLQSAIKKWVQARRKEKRSALGKVLCDDVTGLVMAY
jgi:hypothetical protein